MQWRGLSEPVQSARESSLEPPLDLELDQRLCDRQPGARQAAGSSAPSGAPATLGNHGSGNPTKSGHEDLFLRPPCPRDGPAVWTLARDSASLDLNSPYCYLLVCSHFADTSLVAEQGGNIVGFVAAYHPPTRPDSIFVWQIAVASSHRGAGLARRLLETLVEQPAVRGVRQLEATVTPSNTASRRLFEGFARRVGATCREEPGFDADLFPPATPAHEPEALLSIGPLDPARRAPERKGTGT